MQKYLIVTSDDFGICHSINYASIEALKKGCITSLTIIPPAPYFKEALLLARKNKIRHMGVHLTLTSEYNTLRYGPVSRASCVPSLIDKDGSFHSTIKAFAKNAKSAEVKFELENQIKKAVKNNITPTHLDNHMFSLHCKVSKRSDFMPIIYYLCRKYKLPFRSPFKKECAYLKNKGVAVLYRSFKQTYDIPASKKECAYNKLLTGLRGGVSELILHCGYNNKELHNITRKSARRQADFDYAVSEKTAALLSKNKIRLISWQAASEYLNNTNES